MARQQRAADKLQKRLQKKQGDSETAENNAENGAEGEDEFAQPKGFDFHDF